MDMHLGKALTALLAAFGSAAAVAEEEAGPFQLHEIDTGIARHQTIVPGSFTDPRSAEIAVLQRVGGGVRVRILQLEGGDWRVAADTAGEGRIAFADVLQLDGRDHLVLYRDGGLAIVDAAHGREHAFVPFPPRVQAAEGGIPRVDVTRDLNGDGRDDLVLPDADGFWLAMQKTDGTFGSPVRLGPREPHLAAKAYGDERTYGEGGITAQNIPWYLGRIHRLDFDRDGRQDLLFWNEDHFELHAQDEDGGFAATPLEFPTDVEFDFDGAYALAFQFGDRGVPSLLLGLGGRFDYTVLHGFHDLNGDDVADLVTVSFSGRRVFSLRGRFSVHFGRPSQGATTFAATPDTVVETPGPAGGLAWGYATQRYLDIDGDGRTDFALAAVDTGVGGMTRAMVGKSITIDLALYRLQGNAYRSEPDAVRRVRTRFAPFDKRGVLFPLVLIGDIDGDGRSDLLTANRWDRLSVHIGGDGPDPFAGDPLHVTVDIPSNEFNSMLADLNHDGREDVVLFHPSETASNRVVVLMAGGTQ